MTGSPVQEIKSRLDIIEVLQEYITLKPAGTHSYRALCPFHNEKTPSFMVSKDKQIWHCFGCSEGGDIFAFVQKYEGMSFPEALRHLANKAGVKLVHQDPALISQKTRLLDLLNLAAQFYREYLLKKDTAKIAREYLQNRGVKDETAEQFKIGYSPDSWDETKKFLLSKGYNEKEIFLAGLLVNNESNKTSYDRFRGRLMFPIFDHNGAVVGFSARILKESKDEGAKYINSPQTIVYDKSQIVYGLNFAKQEIKKQDLTVVVEGQMDVVSSHQAGITNVVASSGTALTQQQLQILKRYSNKLALSFDSDLAGENAAKRGIETALAMEMETRVIVVPHGKDPDECIKNSPQDWKSAISGAQEFMQYYFDKTFSKLDLEKVQDKKTAAKILLPIIKKISNLIEQTFWLKKLSAKLDVEESILRDTLKSVEIPKTNIPTSSPQANMGAQRTAKTREELLSEKLIAVILLQPPILEIANQHLIPEM
ncbi:MAG: DNA primase, partial [bacterium]